MCFQFVYDNLCSKLVFIINIIINIIIIIIIIIIIVLKQACLKCLTAVLK